MAQELEATVTNAVTHCPTCREIFAAGLRFCPKDGGQLVNGYPPDAGRDAGGVAGPGREKDAKATSPLVGKVLAERYRIVRKIGEGGMGEVFEAQHVYIDKRFAIKTLRAEITTNPDAVARFHQEARSASTIGHENIVEIDDFGRLPDGGVYLAMEFLDGISLGDRMKQKPPLPLGEALDYMMQVAQGLAAAHEKGIVHRDMKPENIFLTRKSGRVVAKILDFGIAKVLSDGGQKSLTQTGAVFGTPYYMSPEQALGKPVDARADVYSFGVILYEVFTGRVPFEGESFMGILSQHITAPPKTPSLAAPDRTIPLALERVILRAMAKDPEQRYASMIALGDDLEKVRNGSAFITQNAQRVDRVKKADGVVMPTAESIQAAAPLELDRPGAPGSSIGAAANDPDDPNDPNRARRGRGKAIAAAATAVLLAVGIAGLVMRRTPTSPTKKGIDPGGSTLQATLGNLTPPPLTRLMPADPGEGEVLLDTNPPGAVVYANGQRISETPGLIKVPGGKLLEVLLRKDGFVPKQVRLDGTDKRLIVPLERVHHAGSHLVPPAPVSPPTPSQSPSIVDVDPSAPQNGARVKKPAPRPFKGTDPGYEALPPPSKKTPRNAPPPNAPLDPY